MVKIVELAFNIYVAINFRLQAKLQVTVVDFQH